MNISHPIFQSTILETKSCTVWICILHRRLYWWPSESICFCEFMEWILSFKKNLTLSVVGDSRELTVDVQWTYSICTSTCGTCSVSTANIHHSVVVQNAIWSQKGCNKGSAIWQGGGGGESWMKKTCGALFSDQQDVLTPIGPSWAVQNRTCSVLFRTTDEGPIGVEMSCWSENSVPRVFYAWEFPLSPPLPYSTW